MGTVRDQLFHDIFVTAMEGGIGYWSEALTYKWSDGQGGDDLVNFQAWLVSPDGDEWPRPPADGPKRLLQRSVIARGYRLAAGPDWSHKIAWSTEAPPLVITEDTDWDFDAGDADVIVQLGLFGEVIYG